MARINLTIPDSLYERLELVRDRVNVSKVCAIALGKELDMLENITAASDNQLKQRLILRLRENRDRWYVRGKQDGEEWAADRASMDELRWLDEHWTDKRVTESSELDEIIDETRDEGCPTFNADELLNQWIQKDRNEGTGVEWRSYLLGWFHGARDLWRSAQPSLDM